MTAFMKFDVTWKKWFLFKVEMWEKQECNSVCA